MRIVNTHQAKTQLSQLLAEIEQNNEVVRICRNGKPIADLVPIKKVEDSLRQHPVLREAKILYDPTEPLAEDEWPE